jgi:hypothetical protein
MFKEGAIYKHDNCLDMTILVSSIDEDPELLCVFYLKGDRLIVPESEWVCIPKSNWNDWKQVGDQWIITKS